MDGSREMFTCAHITLTMDAKNMKAPSWAECQPGDKVTFSRDVVKGKGIVYMMIERPHSTPAYVFEATSSDAIPAKSVYKMQDWNSNGKTTVMLFAVA